MIGYRERFKQIKDTLWDVINAAVNRADDGTVLPENHPDAVKIFQAKSQAVRPKSGEYLEFDFLTGVIKMGLHDELVYDESEDSFKLTGQREISVSISAFGDDSNVMVALVQQTLDSPTSTDILRAVGLSVRDAQTIADKDAFLQTDFEQRAVLDVRFGLVLELLDAVSRIERVEIKSKLPGADEDPVIVELD